MQILQIYADYQLPPNLQRHQFEVAAVGLYIVDHWQGPKLKKRALLEATLLHDMGNIVKFRRPFLGELEKDAAHWEKLQDEFIAKYGKNTHSVTEAILKELGTNKDTFEIVRQMGYGTDGDLKAESWEAKIAMFADNCVTPKGIEGFEKRMVDLIHRYNLEGDSLKVQAWQQNADEIQQNVDVELSTIQNTDFSEVIEKLHDQMIS
ncbi:MAG TPA: HD domain-containing protein [Candidatus Saccharimonadia bacterium]|nr:HD domain-containing protein [Candidatus Saccharimonadia bacterium]